LTKTIPLSTAVRRGEVGGVGGKSKPFSYQGRKKGNSKQQHGKKKGAPLASGNPMGWAFVQRAPTGLKGKKGVLLGKRKPGLAHFTGEAAKRIRSKEKSRKRERQALFGKPRKRGGVASRRKFDLTL